MAFCTCTMQQHIRAAELNCVVGRLPSRREDSKYPCEQPSEESDIG